MFFFQSIFFLLATWLGFHLVAREPGRSRLWWTGSGLLLYALLLAGQIVFDGPYTGLLLAIGVLSLVVDVALARQGVLDLGEAFWPNFLRSLVAASLFALFFGVPIALTMFAATGATASMKVLLLATIMLAAATQVWSDTIQALLDRVAFVTRPQLQRTRAELRTAADVLPRINPDFDINAIGEDEFVRLTRRALSHLGDLPRLASSPLTRLPVIDARLDANRTERRAAGDGAATTLARAAELKLLLIEAIARLKPPDGEDFAASDAWRHYNALYFPYVVGLKPYSRRANHHNLDDPARAALDWFRTQVPERTLYNWQNAAANLVAEYLLELTALPGSTDEHQKIQA